MINALFVAVLLLVACATPQKKAIAPDPVIDELQYKVDDIRDKEDQRIERESMLHWWVAELNERTKENAQGIRESQDAIRDLDRWAEYREDACPCK